MTTDTDARYDPPTYVSVILPRCPCGSAHLRAYKTVDNGDGTKTRYSTCQTCGQKLVLVVE